MIADRRSQIADCNKVCDRLRSYGNYFCDRLRSCDGDRRRSQKIEPCSISCDRLRSIAIVCDLRSAICDPRSYGNQPLDRTWFYLLRSSAITIAGSQTLLRSAIIWKPAFLQRTTKKCTNFFNARAEHCFDPLILLFYDVLVVVVVVSA